MSQGVLCSVLQCVLPCVLPCVLLCVLPCVNEREGIISQKSARLSVYYLQQVQVRLFRILIYQTKVAHPYCRLLLVMQRAEAKTFFADNFVHFNFFNFLNVLRMLVLTLVLLRTEHSQKSAVYLLHVVN